MPTILLPALNEAENIKLMVLTAKNLYPAFSVVVADSESTDDTWHIAVQNGAIAIGCPRGKGKTVRYVLDHISDDFMFMLDADCSYPLEYVGDMYKWLKLGICDVIIGSRPSGRIMPGAMSTSHLIGNKGMTLIANMLYRTKTPDLCSGMWGFNQRALKKMRLTADGFDLEANLFTEVNRCGLRFMSIPIHYNRRGGSSKLRVTEGLRIVWRLIAEKCR